MELGPVGCSTAINVLVRFEKPGFQDIGGLQCLGSCSVVRVGYESQEHLTCHQVGVEHKRELLFKDGDMYPFLFTNTFFDYIFYNTVGKDKIRHLVNRRMEQMEIVAKHLEIIDKYNQKTLPRLVFESKMSMYEDMLET